MQVNRNDAAGVPLSGASNAVVLSGDCINTINDEDINTTEAQQEDGCVTIPERVRRTGQRLTVTTGSKVDIDFMTLIGDVNALVSGGQQVGWQDTVTGGTRCVCAGSGAVSVSMLGFYEAWLCGSCIGVAVRGWPSVSLSRTGNRQSQRGSVLSTYTYAGQYTPNSGYGRGPGNILPAAMPITGPSFEVLQSPTTAISPLPIVTPVVPDVVPATPSEDNCQQCGLLPHGFLSAPFAVGGALNGLPVVP